MSNLDLFIRQLKIHEELMEYVKNGKSTINVDVLCLGRIQLSISTNDLLLDSLIDLTNILATVIGNNFITTLQLALIESEKLTRELKIKAIEEAKQFIAENIKEFK